MTDFTRQRMAHPARLNEACATLSRALRIHSEGHIPECIEASVLAVPARRLLRVLDGGNFRCAWAFFVRGVADLEPMWLTRWRYRREIAEDAAMELEGEAAGLQRLPDDGRDTTFTEGQ